MSLCMSVLFCYCHCQTSEFFHRSKSCIACPASLRQHINMGCKPAPVSLLGSATSQAGLGSWNPSGTCWHIILLYSTSEKSSDRLVVNSIDLCRCSSSLMLAGRRTHQAYLLDTQKYGNGLTDKLADLLHGAESFLRSWQFLSWSRNYLHFMGNGISLPYSQTPAICPYPEPDQSSTRRPFLLLEDQLIRFTLGCSTWRFSFTFPHQNLVCICVLPIHAAGPGYSIHIPVRNQIAKLFILQFFSRPLSLILLLLSTLFSNTDSLASFLNVSDRVSYPYKTQEELSLTLTKNATNPDPSEIIQLQTTRKKINWKTKETLARTAVTPGDGTDQRVQFLMFMMMMMHLQLTATCFDFLEPSSGWT